MAWVDDHQKSEAFASKADVRKRMSDSSRADKLYRLAAESELSALSCIPPGKNRTLGIIAVSAASLFFKAHKPDLAQLPQLGQNRSRKSLYIPNTIGKVFTTCPSFLIAGAA